MKTRKGTIKFATPTNVVDRKGALEWIVRDVRSLSDLGGTAHAAGVKHVHLVPDTKLSPIDAIDLVGYDAVQVEFVLAALRAIVLFIRSRKYLVLFFRHVVASGMYPSAYEV